MTCEREQQNARTGPLMFNDPSLIGERLHSAAVALLEAMPDSVREEFVELAALGDELDAGLFLIAESADMYAITWQGRYLGSVCGEWLRTGVEP